jgi:O-antigen/teichoic acid export membrane protein
MNLGMTINLSEWRTLIGQTKSGLVRLRQSKFARDAAWLFVLNLLSRGVGFFGTAYAMRSLGPVNVGISALIQVTVQQAALSFNCGFDVIAVRRIADDHGNTGVVTTTAVTFRLALAVIASLIWVIVCYLVPESQRWVWLLGVPIMIAGAGSIGFVFCGQEKLPIQNAIGTGGVLLSAIAYFVFFRPNMFLGADLIVISIIGLTTMGVSWWMYHRLCGFWPVGQVVIGQLRLLFRESWRYWLLAVMVFFYSMFQFPLIAYLLGPRELGIFRSAFGLAAGVELLFNSINSLLLARLVNWQKMGLDVMWHRQTKLLFVFLIIGLPIVGILILAAPMIYSLFLGDAFKEGILVFQILVVGRLVVFLGQIYAWGLVAVGQDNQFLFASLLGAISSITMNLIVIPKYGIAGAAIVSVASEFLLVTTIFLFVRRHITQARAY